MLQRQQAPPAQSADEVTAAAAETFQFILDFVRRQYWAIAFGAAIMLAMGFIYLFTTPPRFTATAALLIDAQNARLLQQQSTFGEVPVGIDPGVVESQVQIIKSDKVALAVIKKLHLADDPEFVGPSGGLLGVLLSSVANLLASSAPSSEFVLTRQAVGVFHSRLDVRRVGLTYVINISFQSLSPDRAAQIANAVADAYIDDQLGAKYQTARRAGTWLQDRLRELSEQAAVAERAVVTFKAKNNIVDAGGRSMTDQQLAELNSELVIAKSQTAEASAKVARVQAVLMNNTPEAAIDATVADSLHNTVITTLRSQYLKLRGRESDWAIRYGYNHLAVVNLRNQMGELQNSIRNELQRIAQSYKSDLNISEQHEASVQSQLDQAVRQHQANNQSEIVLRELESQAQTYRALYDNFLQRYMTSIQEQTFPITNARVISAATRPLSKSHPRTRMVLAVALLAGLGLGVAAGAWREFADRVFRTSAQIEARLQIDCIALVPAVREAAAKGKADSRQTTKTGETVNSPITSQRKIVAPPGIFSTVVESPLSAFAESIRSLKVAIDSSPTAAGGKIIGFTSSVPSEGKSSVACALARLAARSGTRTILVDCDLRNPSLSRALSPGAAGGLLDVMAGRLPLDQAIWLDGVTKMKFLPGATKARLAHSSEIIASGQMRSLFDQLRQSYDYIIVDFAPLMPIVDVRASMHLVDGYVYVVEWGRTRIEHVEQALQSARGVYEHLLGVVLNKVSLASLGRYDGRGGYYRDERYRRYGYGE